MNRKLLNESERLDIPARIFGAHFPFKVEPSIYNIARFLSGEYTGGYWLMYELENGGFYMAPNAINFSALAENGYGITVCLYVYSELSFQEIRGCAKQYHLLR